jgi:hypothetical protein
MRRQPNLIGAGYSVEERISISKRIGEGRQKRRLRVMLKTRELSRRSDQKSHPEPAPITRLTVLSERVEGVDCTSHPTHLAARKPDSTVMFFHAKGARDH